MSAVVYRLLTVAEIKIDVGLDFVVVVALIGLLFKSKSKLKAKLCSTKQQNKPPPPQQLIIIDGVESISSAISSIIIECPIL